MVAVVALSMLWPPRLLRVQITVESTYQELIQRAGKGNGYGDYVRAALILDRVENRGLVSSLTNSPTVTEPFPEVMPGLSRSSQRRVAIARLDEALPLLRRGNTKPSAYPFSHFTQRTLMPELGRFRAASWLFVRAAEAAFEDGDNPKGGALLLDGLEFATRIGRGTLIHALVGSSCRSIVLRSVRENFNRLSIGDLDRLARWSRRELSRPMPMLQAMIAERESMRRSWFEFCDDASLDLRSLRLPEESVSKITAGLRSLSRRRKAEMYDQFLARLESPYRAVETRLRQPETRWSRALPIPVYSPAEVRPHDSSPEVMAGFLMYLRLSALLRADGTDEELTSGWMRTAVRDRIQASVTGLYASVGRFRLQHGRLPHTLEEAAGRVSREPITGKPYLYWRRFDGATFGVLTHLADGEQDLIFRRTGAKNAGR